MLEKDVKAAARNFPQDSQNCLARVLWAGNLGGGQPSGEVRLGGRFSCAKRALLFRFSPAHRATDGQYLSQGEFGLHTNIIQHRQLEKMVNLALRRSTGPQNGNLGGRSVSLGAKGDRDFVALQERYAWILSTRISTCESRLEQAQSSWVSGQNWTVPFRMLRQTLGGKGTSFWSIAN